MPHRNPKRCGTDYLKRSNSADRTAPNNVGKPTIAASFQRSATIYKAIITSEQLSAKVWADFKEMAIAYAEDRVFHNDKMMKMMGIDGFDQRELDWLIQFDIKTMETHVLMIVTYDYPAKEKTPNRYASVTVTLPRIAGNIGYGEPKVLPTFYAGHMSDPDFRLQNGIA